MAILRAEEIRDMSLAEMREKRVNLRAEYSKEQALLATGTAPENPGRIKALRRTIARLNTIIHQREEEERLNQ
jgi:large subunit ribosomal protein L29